MDNLYDLEKLLETRRREIEGRLETESLVRQLPEHQRSSSQDSGQVLRVRFGQMLIRLGARLAA